MAVRPHVLKYLHAHVGPHYFLSQSDHFGLFLFYLMRHPVTDARKDHLVAEYKATFTVHYGSYKPSQYGLKGLTGKTVHQFNRFVHELILHELYGFVDVATDHGNPVTYAIEQFMAKYGFDESDVQFETLKKSWQRFAEDRKLKKKKVVALTPRKALKDLQRTLTAAVKAA